MSSTDISNILKQLDELSQPRQLPALFKPHNISPVLGSPEKKNPMSGYFVGGEGAEPDAKPVRYAIRHRETGRTLSSHQDEAAARDEMAGLGDQRQEYKLVKTSRRPNQFGLDEEDSGGQQYAVTIDAIDHGVLSPVTVTASSPAAAKQKAIASATASMAKRGYELQVRSAGVKSAQGMSEGSEPGYVKYEQMKDKISGVLIKLYKQGKDAETIKQMGSRVAKHLGYDPTDSIYQDAWLTSFNDASLDGSLDQDSDDDYTDYSMRQGERGNPGKFREQGVAEALDPDTQRLEQEVRDALANGDDYTAKSLVKMAQTAADRNHLRKIIRQAMYGKGPGQGGATVHKEEYVAEAKVIGHVGDVAGHGKVVQCAKCETDLRDDHGFALDNGTYICRSGKCSMRQAKNRLAAMAARGEKPRWRKDEGVAEGSSSPDEYERRLASIQSLRYDNPQEYAKQYRALLQAMPEEHAAHATQAQKGSYSPGERGSGTGRIGGVTEGERAMSRAAKGYEKYGKAGMQALAKAGREGKDLDKIRDKYNKYDESIEASPMVKPPSNRFDSKPEAFAHAKAHGGKVFKRTYTDPNTGNKHVSFVVKKEQDVEEGWKQKLGAAALAGSMAMGASARVVPGQDEPGVNRLTGKPNVSQVVPDVPEQPILKGFSTSYLQKAADPNRFGRFLISVEDAKAEVDRRAAAYELRSQGDQKTNEQGVAEVAPPGARAERMVKHIKQGYAKDGKLTGKEKAIAYATTWKAHNKGQVEEASADLVGFHLDTERAYNAVMERFGDVVEQDQESGMMTVPRRYWLQLEQVAHDADGIGAIEAGGEKIAVDEVEESYWQPQIDEAIAQEDVLDKEKRHLGDYLQSVADAVKHDAALSSKDAPTHSGDTIGSAVKTVTTDDGHDLKIHGNEDDGFRISIKGRPSRVKFKSLDEAGMACEMYRSHRRHKLESADYIEEQ